MTILLSVILLIPINELIHHSYIHVHIGPSCTVYYNLHVYMYVHCTLQNVPYFI